MNNPQGQIQIKATISGLLGPCKPWVSVLSLLQGGCPSDVPWFIVPHWVDAVNRRAFWPGTQLGKPLLERLKSEFNQFIRVFVVCFDSLLCFVVAISAS
jgi:hypothetical protein